MTIPDTVAEMCRPGATAVLVYDAQDGILAHVCDREQLVERIGEVVRAGREQECPCSTSGTCRCRRRTWAWAGSGRPWPGSELTNAAEVKTAFPPGAAHTQIVSELAPRDGEPVFEKLGCQRWSARRSRCARDRGVTTWPWSGPSWRSGSSPRRGTPRTSGSCRSWSRTVRGRGPRGCGTIPGEPGLQPAELPLLHEALVEAFQR